MRKEKIIDLRSGDPGFEPQIFSNFPAQDLIFHGNRGAQDQIKTSKRDGTLRCVEWICSNLPTFDNIGSSLKLKNILEIAKYLHKPTASYLQNRDRIKRTQLFKESPNFGIS